MLGKAHEGEEPYFGGVLCGIEKAHDGEKLCYRGIFYEFKYLINPKIRKFTEAYGPGLRVTQK